MTEHQVDRLSSFADQETVAISIEYGDQPACRFDIQKSLLSTHSGQFRNFFENDNTPGRELFLLSDNDPELIFEPMIPPAAFDVFVKWLYTQEIILDGVKTSDVSIDAANHPETYQYWHNELNRGNRLHIRLIDLYYSLAQDYMVPSFKIAIMLAFQRSSEVTLVQPIVIEYAWRKYDRIIDPGGLGLYLFRYCGHLAPRWWFGDSFRFEKKLASLPPLFLAKTLMMAPHFTSGNGKPIVDEWCDFHEHRSDEERKECQEGRPNDPDVIKNQTGGDMQ